MMVGNPCLCAMLVILSKVGYVILGIARRFDIDRSRFVVNQFLNLFRMARIEESHFDAKLGKRLIEQRPSAAVETGRGDKVLARMDDRHDGGRNRSRAAGESQRASPAVQSCKSFFQHVGRWVHEPRVDIAEFPQTEQVRRMVGVVKYVTCRCVDRHGASRRRGVGGLARMQSQRAETLRNSWFLTHVRPLLQLSVVFMNGCIFHGVLSVEKQCRNDFGDIHVLAFKQLLCHDEKSCD